MSSGRRASETSTPAASRAAFYARERAPAIWRHDCTQRRHAWAHRFIRGVLATHLQAMCSGFETDPMAFETFFGAALHFTGHFMRHFVILSVRTGLLSLFRMCT